VDYVQLVQTKPTLRRVGAGRYDKRSPQDGTKSQPFDEEGCRKQQQILIARRRAQEVSRCIAQQIDGKEFIEQPHVSLTNWAFHEVRRSQSDRPRPIFQLLISGTISRMQPLTA